MVYEGIHVQVVRIRPPINAGQAISVVSAINIVCELLKNRAAAGQLDNTYELN